MMNNDQINILANKFRTAIEKAYSHSCFGNDRSFRQFPNGCCGDTCYLLAEYLKQYSIRSIYYSGERKDGSHAWLVIMDELVKPISSHFIELPPEIKDALVDYGINLQDDTINKSIYVNDDLINGTIIDITGDQFPEYNKRVYVGPKDDFHKAFDFVEADVINEIPNERLYMLYRIIEKFI